MNGIRQNYDSNQNINQIINLAIIAIMYPLPIVKWYMSEIITNLSNCASKNIFDYKL